jgi:Fic family protein
MKTPHHYIWQREGWPKFIYNKEALEDELAEINRQGGALSVIGRIVSDKDLQQASLESMCHEIVNSSEIEGEVLNRDSVRSSIRKKLGLMEQIEKDQSSQQTDGLVEILLDATRNSTEPLTNDRLLGWHHALFPTGRSGIRKIDVGAFRKDLEGPMQVVSGEGTVREKVHYEAPPAADIELEMYRFLEYINHNSDDNCYIKAGIAHLWFLSIHPLDDGNGRIARTITDMLLSRCEAEETRIYSLSRSIKSDHKGYYETLDRTTKNKTDMDITMWLLWFLKTLKIAQKQALDEIDTIIAKAKFWQEHREDPLNDRQIKVLSRLLDAGDDFKGGLSNKKYCKMTGISDATASRDLDQLLKFGCLVKNGKGPATRYEINYG